MNEPKQMPLLPVVGIAAVLAVVSGLAAQLCRIGHGPIVPVAILAPYAALLILGGFEVLPVWIAVLQFPIYAAGLVLSRARGTMTGGVSRNRNGRPGPPRPAGSTAPVAWARAAR